MTSYHKKIYFLLLFLIVSSALFAQDENSAPVVSQNYDAQSFFIEGKSLEMQYKYIPALENYKTALKFDKAPGIYFAIANVYYNLEKYQDAIFEINNALKLAPDEIKYLELKANIYYSQDNYEKAAETYEQIVNIDSNYIYGLYFLARMYQE
ncbi:MAG TPA: tetratricopeptide repeat protein, partial [Ignavibacteria bacterium]